MDAWSLRLIYNNMCVIQPEQAVYPDLAEYLNEVSGMRPDERVKKCSYSGETFTRSSKLPCP
jgi:hypothetical protein